MHKTRRSLRTSIPLKMFRSLEKISTLFIFLVTEFKIYFKFLKNILEFYFCPFICLILPQKIILISLCINITPESVSVLEMQRKLNCSKQFKLAQSWVCCSIDTCITNHFLPQWCRLSLSLSLATLTSTYSAHIIHQHQAANADFARGDRGIDRQVLSKTWRSGKVQQREISLTRQTERERGERARERDSLKPINQNEHITTQNADQKLKIFNLSAFKPISCRATAAKLNHHCGGEMCGGCVCVRGCMGCCLWLQVYDTCS